VNKHSVFYSQGFRKNQLRNNFGVFLTFFKVVLVLFVQKWKVKNIAFKPKIKCVCANFGMVATVHSIRELGTLSLNK